MRKKNNPVLIVCVLICLFVGGCGSTDKGNSSTAATGREHPAAVTISDPESPEGSAEKDTSPQKEDPIEKDSSEEKKESPDQNASGEKENYSKKSAFSEGTGDGLDSSDQAVPAEGAGNGLDSSNQAVPAEGGESLDSLDQAVPAEGGESPAGSTAAETGSTAAESAAKDSAGDNPADYSSAESAVAKPRMLEYIDAWQEWHVMEVDPSVTENIYDPDSWVVQPDGRTTLKDELYEVLQGVDVSEHQGYIDWEAVAQAGVRFAFIRVAYRGYGQAGTMFEDATAVDNLRNAKAAGLQVGTYVFSQALNEEEAREEASVSLRVINASGIKPDLPLMYDPELIKDDVGRANGITREQVSLNTAAFRDEVEQHSDVKVDIYSNLPWEHNYFDAGTMNQYEIWYADYEKIPQTPYHFVWWQYTNEGYVPGIEGRVDLDLWVRPVEVSE